MLPSASAFIFCVLVSNLVSSLLLLQHVHRKHRSGQCTTLKSCRPAMSKACPYEYLLSIYGEHHFKDIISFLKSDLEHSDPELHSLVLEILDTVHFGAILVDDLADDSKLRKGTIAAHRIYGDSETINRAYLVILKALVKCQELRPRLVPFILDCLTQIHQGQDDSLVWRRDGFPFTPDASSALQLYQDCASLKTGGLFRLVGQLITGSHELDALMSDYGWYCQLQNDCKNVFSSDMIRAKGALAEDLRNGEFTYPILVALYSSTSVKQAVERAFNRKSDGASASALAMEDAMRALQSEEVRGPCLTTLESVRTRNQQFAFLWGRSEKMCLS